MNLVYGARGGKAYDPTYGTRMRGTGEYAAMLKKRFEIAASRLGLNPQGRNRLDTGLFHPPLERDGQLSLF